MVTDRIPWVLPTLVVLLASCNRGTRVPWTYEPSDRSVISVSSAQGLTVDSSGTLGMLVVTAEGGKTVVGYTMSHDGGDSFMHVVPVSDPDGSVSVQAESSPTISKVPTAVYALWEQKGNGSSNDLMLGRSLSYGHSFQTPVRVNDEQTAFHGFSSVAATPDGAVYVVWLDAREKNPSSETFDVYWARSRNQGASFEKNRLVARAACPCCRPSIAVGEAGEIYIAWRKVFSGDVRDIVVSASLDGGQTFGPEVRVADDGWRLRGCPHSGPSMIQSGERVYVAWVTEGRDGRPRIELSWSGDRGRHFYAPIEASADTLDPNHPVLAASEDGHVLLAFQARKRNADGSWEPATAFVEEIHGDRISTPIALSNAGSSVSYPHLVVATGGRAYLAWTQRTGQTSAVELVRGRHER